MMTSKFIGHFLEEISGWQKTLCTVDTVITLWMDVQRTWSFNHMFKHISDIDISIRV